MVFGFRKKYKWFFGFGFQCGFWFFLFCPVRVLVSHQVERQLISNSHKTPKLLRRMHDKLNVTAGDHTSQMMPETSTSQSRAIIWSVSNMPPAPAMEGANYCGLCCIFLRGGERQQECLKEKHF